MTAPFAKFIRLIVIASVSVFVLSESASVCHVEAGEDTQSIQARLDAASRRKLEVSKQIALKKAAVDVADKRVVQLQQQLEDSRQQLAADRKSLEAVTASEMSVAKEVAELAQQLKLHQHVDSLIASALAAKQAADDAQKLHAGLQSELALVKTRQLEQQQLEAKAAADLKAAQDTLPKVMEELSAARVAYDMMAREIDIARAALGESRRVVREKSNALQVEKNRKHSAATALANVNSSVQSLKESMATLQAAALATGLNPEEAGSELAASILAIGPLQKRAAELLAISGARVAEADIQLASSNADFAAAENALRDQQSKFEAQSRIHFQLQLRVADLQNGDRLHQQQIAESKALQESLIAQQTELETQITAASAKLKQLNEEYVQKQKLAESAMEPLGRFVSFSQHIAPIFAKKCVACHNRRTASGRLNMDSFAALAKGGESGAAFESHSAESSLLWSMIEDGSMPKDADPLSKDELALIRQWIEVGAPLDAGVVATADLFDLIPEIAQPLPPQTYRVPIPVTATAFNPDASILASSGYHEILLWKTEDGSLIRRITNVAERVYDLEFNSDGSQLAVAAGTPGQLGEVKLFATADGAHLKTLVRTKDAVYAIAFSPDGSLIAAGGADRVVHVVEVSSGKVVREIEDHADWVMDVNWSSDGQRLVTSSRDKTVKLFNVSNGVSVTTFSGHGQAVYSAAFSNDGKSVVSAGSDRHVRVWNVADGKEIRKIGGFGSDIFRVVVTPDNHLLTACADRNAREHNLEDGKKIRAFAGHKDWVYTLCYNVGSRLIATGSYDGEIRVWNSADGSVATSFIAIPKAADSSVVAAEE
ncbi:MAG: c-type cytochrome domain-containing protein [Fuerstiella sp.]|mgnify:CR=1 FL=1